MVRACRRVRHTERAVDSLAVTQLHLVVRRPAVLIVASFAEVVRAKAVEQGDGAAIHALPVDLLRAMLVTALHSGSVCFHLAVTASQVFLFRLLFHIELPLTVDHAAKVRLLTIGALIKGTLVHG